VQRVFSYSLRKDRLLLLSSVVASVCAGATLPLMNIIFGKTRHTIYAQGETYSSLSSTNGQKLQRDCSKISVPRGIEILHVRDQSIRVSKPQDFDLREVDPNQVVHRIPLPRTVLACICRHCKSNSVYMALIPDLIPRTHSMASVL
jgi:hypothetical protein